MLISCFVDQAKANHFKASQEFPSPEKFKALMEGISCATSIESTNVSEDGGETKTVERQAGAFRVEEVRQMNFGSVQLYLATPYTS